MQTPHPTFSFADEATGGLRGSVTCPRPQSQSASFQPKALSTVLLPIGHRKRNSKLSFKMAEMDLLKRSSSALLLEKGKEKE